jgi:hypothetical protein
MTHSKTIALMRLLPIIVATFLGVVPLQARAADEAWSSPPATSGGGIVFRVAAARNEDPAAAGKAAAESLKKEMGGVPLRAVIVSECFEDKENKEKLLESLAAVLPKEILLGSATYGSFTQSGANDADSVCLLGIGGDGISVSASLVQSLGTAKLTFEQHRDEIEKRLHQAGASLVGKLRRGRPCAKEPALGRRNAEGAWQAVSHHRRVCQQKCRPDVRLLSR